MGIRFSFPSVTLTKKLTWKNWKITEKLTEKRDGKKLTEKNWKITEKNWKITEKNWKNSKIKWKKLKKLKN